MSDVMKITWLTDIHLNFLSTEERIDFYLHVATTSGDAVVITGDIAEATSISKILNEMAAHIKKPIFFVLGNHDYYRGQIDTVKSEIVKLTKSQNLLHWMPAAGPCFLENDTVLLGQDGWADGRYGDYNNSRVVLNDSRLIADLFQQRMIGKYPLVEKMQELADQDAKALHDNLTATLNEHHPIKIIVLTHVPPFKEACLYAGKISDDDYLPFFGSKATGDVLLEVANKNPNVDFLVLCGHTHGEAHYQPLGNLEVKVGGAEYYQPKVQEILSI
jgi:predicted MPP superfamily phosphohydrolase